MEPAYKELATSYCQWLGNPIFPAKTQRRMCKGEFSKQETPAVISVGSLLRT